MNSSLQIVGLGEALYDVFPNRRVLGGAPLNVAFHAHQLLQSLGGEGVIVSRVGSDEAGRELLEEVSRWGSNRFLQVDPDHPTGRVLVKHSGSEVQYEIVEEVAWDYLAWTPELSELSRSCDALAFGSLAQRASPSRETIQRFVREAIQAIRLFDANLRQSFYSPEILRESCQLASLVKCNHEELSTMHRLCCATSPRSEQEQIRDLMEQFGLEAFVLTRGAEDHLFHFFDVFVDAHVLNAFRHQ